MTSPSSVTITPFDAEVPISMPIKTGLLVIGGSQIHRSTTPGRLRNRRQDTRHNQPVFTAGEYRPIIDHRIHKTRDRFQDEAAHTGRIAADRKAQDVL